jgi:hypothetical protein
VIKADITVEREDRFQLDTGEIFVRHKCCLCTPAPAQNACALRTAGGMPCDVTLKLPCGAEVTAVSQLLKMASPVLRDLLEDVTGSAPIPVSGMRTFVLCAALCLWPADKHPHCVHLLSLRWTAASARGPPS